MSTTPAIPTLPAPGYRTGRILGTLAALFLILVALLGR